MHEEAQHGAACGNKEPKPTMVSIPGAMDK